MHFAKILCMSKIVLKMAIVRGRLRVLLCFPSLRMLSMLDFAAGTQKQIIWFVFDNSVVILFLSASRFLSPLNCCWIILAWGWLLIASICLCFFERKDASYLIFKSLFSPLVPNFAILRCCLQRVCSRSTLTVFRVERKSVGFLRSDWISLSDSEIDSSYALRLTSFSLSAAPKWYRVSLRRPSGDDFFCFLKKALISSSSARVVWSSSSSQLQMGVFVVQTFSPKISVIPTECNTGLYCDFYLSVSEVREQSEIPTKGYQGTGNCLRFLPKGITVLEIWYVILKGRCYRTPDIRFLLIPTWRSN